MCKILSIDTDAESEFRAPSNPDDLTGLEAFAFGYEVQWPVSLVLNRNVVLIRSFLLFVGLLTWISITGSLWRATRCFSGTSSSASTSRDCSATCGYPQRY